MRTRNLFLGAAAAILCYQLFLPPIVGLADNGDFAKLTGRFDLHAKTFRVGQFVDATYEIDPKWHWSGPYYSSETLLILPALLLNALVSKDGNFDLRLIGAVHGALFLASLWLLWPLLARKRPVVRAAVCTLIIFMYCDVMYVSGLNSFYMDEPAYLFLLLSAVLYLRAVRSRTTVDVIWLLVCGLLLATSKTQHAPLGLLFAVLLFFARRSLWPQRPRALAASAVCLALASCLMIWRGVPPGYADYPIYNVVFRQILPHSKHMRLTLMDLDLDDTYAQYIGKNSFEPESHMADPAFRAAFDKRVSLGKLLLFYVKHPRDAWETLRGSLNAAGQRRIFGNFDASAGYAPGMESHAFAWWSNFNRSLFYLRGARLFFVFLGFIALVSSLLGFYRRSLPPGIAPAGYVLIVMAFAELLISSMLDSADVARHHFIFFALFDMIVITAVCLVLRAAHVFDDRLPARAGTQQPAPPLIAAADAGS